VTELAQRLAVVPLFAELPADDLARVCAGALELRLAAGDQLFAEGDPGEHAYVITSGEVEIRKASLGREVLLAVRHAGEVIGEMALLQQEPRNATARARTEAELVGIPRDVLDDVLATSASAARSLFGVLLQRWRETQSQLRQSERMAQLGTLTAGLAHELNNPAAAVQRAAAQLEETIDRLETAHAAGGALSEAARTALGRLAPGPGAAPPVLDTLERSDREEEVGEWLSDLGVEDGWELAPALVRAGLDREALAAAVADLDRDEAATVLRASCAAGEVRGLLREVTEGAARLSAIVRALKSYSYLDRAPVQSVDVGTGLDDTLLILKSKLSGIDIVREYAADLPLIEAAGSELNQVWTNLVDNAADAVRSSGRQDGRVIVRARAEGDALVVEVEDNGTGVPAEHRERVFDSFFTTKSPGSGTGLGLDISFRIVVQEHGGSLELAHSEPGRTVFRVELPLTATRAVELM
jgi:signal transduction histidine kinase